MKANLNCAGVLALSLTAAAAWAGEADIRHGRYLIQTSGCNDCHTAGYMLKDGHVPEADWLTGDTLGWRIIVRTPRARPAR